MVKKHKTKHRNSTFKSYILYKVTADRRYRPGDIHINSNVQLVVEMLAIEACHQEGKDADGGDGQLEAAAAAPLQEGTHGFDIGPTKNIMIWTRDEEERVSCLVAHVR